MKTIVERPQSTPRSDSGYSGVSAPSAMSVDFERQAVLYLPDGRVLVRNAGY